MAAADFTDVTGGECVGPGKQVLGLMPSRLRSRQPLDGECRLAMAHEQMDRLARSMSCVWCTWNIPHGPQASEAVDGHCTDSTPSSVRSRWISAIN